MSTEKIIPFPWQQQYWKIIHTAHCANRMPHAILLSGPAKIGLQHFSTCLSTSLLCESVDQHFHACGNCRSCHLNHSKSHPDILAISPQGTDKQIKVDEIRKLINFLQLKSQYRRYKIAIIAPANAMNKNAANALLKILEEPPQQSLLILLSHRQNVLPITIRSRCQQIKFMPNFDPQTIAWVQQTFPQHENAKQLLEQAGGVPLMISDLLENNHINIILEDMLTLTNQVGNPVKIAEQWKEYEISQVLLWLSQLLFDLIRIKLLIAPKRISDPHIINRLHILVKQLQLDQLSLFYDTLLENYILSNSLISYKPQGLLENVIISWQRLIKNTINLKR